MMLVIIFHEAGAAENYHKRISEEVRALHLYLSISEKYLPTERCQRIRTSWSEGAGAGGILNTGSWKWR